MDERTKKLRDSLETTVLHLIEHLSQEAHEHNVTVETLCPCYQELLDGPAKLVQETDEAFGLSPHYSW